MKISNSKEMALIEGATLYRVQKNCEDCGHPGARFVRDDRCLICQRHKISILSVLIHGSDPQWEGGMSAYFLGTHEDGSPLFARADWVEELLPYRDAARENGYSLALNPCYRCGNPRLHKQGERGCWACRTKSKSPRQQAKEDGETWYWPTKECHKCGLKAPKRVHDGRCQGCHPVSIPKPPNTVAKSPRQKALAAGEPRYVPDEPCPKCGQRAEQAVNYRRCYGCHPLKQDPVTSPRQKAIVAGETWYTPRKPCERCGLTAPKRVHDGRCQGCHPLKRSTGDAATSPRQKALAAGETWYTPDSACRHCGQHAPRRVHDGRCHGCHPLKRTTPLTDTDREIMRTCPDMELTMEQAKGLGLNIYCEGGKWLRVDTGAPAT